MLGIVPVSWLFGKELVREVRRVWIQCLLLTHSVESIVVVNSAGRVPLILLSPRYLDSELGRVIL
jgi:hypothetical protein